MSEWSAQRRFPRYLIQVPLLHREITPIAVKAGVGWTRDLSEGGACVELADTSRPGMLLRLRFQTDRGAIEMEARVIWSGPATAPGGVVPHGLAFGETAFDRLQTLRDLLLSEGEVRHAGARLPLELSATCQRKGELGPSLQGWTSDIGRGGLLLRLPQALAPGVVLELTLHTPGAPMTVEGAIVWVEPPEKRAPGAPIEHGLRFIAFDRSLSIPLGHLLAEPL